MNRDEKGFTLVELLVVSMMLSIVMVGFYQVMFQGTRGSDTTRAVVRTSEEARLGLNRMIRDTREAQRIQKATATEYEVYINFDRDSNPKESPNESGDYEDMWFTFSGNAIKAGPLGGQEILISGIRCVDNDCAANPIFTYTSNELEWDWDGDGITTGKEVNDATPAKGVIGVGDGDVPFLIDTNGEFAAITGVVYRFEIVNDDRIAEFQSEAELRNRR